MAKIAKGFSASKASIIFDEDDDGIKLVEETKDGMNVYDFKKILKDWDGIEGVSISISLKEDIAPDETEI